MSYIKKGKHCWLWTGPRRGGYGLFIVGNASKTGTAIPAHRLVYEILVGPVLPGKHLDHLCRVKPCVNPSHLEPVTARENTLRGVGPAARNAKKQRCKNGHQFTIKVYRRGGVERRCRECYEQRRLLRSAA